MIDATELAQQLAPIRMPADFATFGFPDLLAAFAIGFVLSCAVMALLRPLVFSRDTPDRLAREEIRRLATKEPEQRLFGLTALLNRLDPGRKVKRPDTLSRALYQPAVPVEMERVEEAILEAARMAARRR
ncbi:hypothetical protein KHP62_14875 [Rhodobacteraceae bacterium NNCM2]|nr:hypothetical protein [Coraliihabitans acroporae]